MTPTEINIAIAESCPSVHAKYYPPDWSPDWPENYDNDLNAMHEVEKKLLDSAEFYEEYQEQLAFVCGLFKSSDVRPWYETIGGRWAVIVATAAQRAEAYLRTIGKWKV